MSVYLEPSTSATENELRRLCEIVTQAIRNFAPRFWHEREPLRLDLLASHVSIVVQREQTATTTITASHWKFDGSADRAIFNITPQNLDRGEKDCASRFIYCAKASRANRNDGVANNHPTVKPTELMRYLCRLVTPPGGIVLDPFMGSGSTGRGAVLEGFNFVGIEREAEYMEIARARIEAAQQNSRDVEAGGRDELPLFAGAST